METNHVYSRGLATVLLVVGLVTFCHGQCGTTLYQEGPTCVAPDPGPCVVSQVSDTADEATATIWDEPSGDMAEAGILGYSDPTAEAAPTLVIPEDGGTLEPAEDTDHGCPTRVSSGMAEPTEREYISEPTLVTEQDYVPEPSRVMEEDYTPGPTQVMEQGYTPEPTGQTEPQYVPEPTRVVGQEYTPGPMDVMDNSSSVGSE